MATLVTTSIEPNDFLGAVWALLGVEDLALVIDGTGGCGFFLLVNADIGTRQRMQGRVFSTVLDEQDVLFGGGETKLAETIRAADDACHPSVIAVVANPVSTMVGVDVRAALHEVAGEVGARLVAFTDGGWSGTADDGAARVFLRLCENLCPPTAQPSGVVNVLGPTVETFNWASDEIELRRLLALLGLEVGTVLTHRTTAGDIARLADGALNLVTSAAALPAAHWLQDRYGTPFVHGLPFGRRGTLAWLEAVAGCTGRTVPDGLLEIQTASVPPVRALDVGGHFRHAVPKVVIGGPAEVALGLARVVREDWCFEVPAVRLAQDPGDEGRRALAALGVGQVLVCPSERDWRAALAAARADVLLGSADDDALAPGIPARLRVAAPAPSVLDFHPGTPFVGWRGYSWLTQTVINTLQSATGGWSAPIGGSR